MAIGRISGSVLKSNLTRNGTDLAFETNLLYLDVTNNRVGIGTSEPSTELTVSGTTTTTALAVSGSTATVDSKDIITGKNEGTNFTGSLLVGHATSGTLSTAIRNTGVGIVALDALTSGDNNTAVGYNAGTTITSGSSNTAIGSTALVTTNGDNNTAVGHLAMRDATSGGANVAIGSQAGLTMSGGSAAYNIVIGHQAGDNISSGAGNIVIGSADVDSATGNRQLVIAGNDGSSTTTWIKGSSSGAVTLSGAITFPTSDGSNGQVLQTDGAGNLSFAESSGGGGGNNTAIKQFNHFKLGTTSAVIDSFDIDEFRGAIYDIELDDTENNMVGHLKVSVVHDDSTPYVSVYDVNEDSTRIADFTVAISGDNVQLSAATNTSSHVNLRCYRVALGDHHETVANTNSKIIATSTNIGSSATTLDQFTKTDIQGAKYIILIKDSTQSDFQISEMSLTHDGTTVFFNDYAKVSTRSEYGFTFSAAISSSTVTLSGASTFGTTATAIMYRIDLGSKTKLGEYDNVFYGKKSDMDSTVETVDEFDVFKYRSARYFVNVANSGITEFQNAEITLTVNSAGTDATISSSSIATGDNDLASFTADVSGGKARLRASSMTNSVIRFARLAIEANNIYKAAADTSNNLYITHNNIKQTDTQLILSGSTGALTLPKGTTAQRPTGVTGMLRYNTSTDTYERFDSTTSTFIDIATQASSSEADDTSTGVKTSIGTSATNIDTFTTNTLDSAFYLAVTKDEINDEVATDQISLVHNDSDAFVSSGGGVRSGDNDHITYTADVNSGTVRLRATGTAAVNSIKFFRIALGDSTSASSTGNTATIINSDVDSAVENLDTFAKGTFRGAKYYISANNSSKTELQNIECLVVHNGTDAFITSYNDIFTGDNPLISVTADISGSDVRLRATGNEPNTAVKMYRILLGDSESDASSTNTKTVGQTTTSSSATTMDTFTTDSANGAHYVVVGNNSTEEAASISEVFVVTDGTDAYVSSGPIVSTKGSDQLTFTASLSGTTVTVSAASTSGGSTTVNAFRTQLLRESAGAATNIQVLTTTEQTISGDKTFTDGTELKFGTDADANIKHTGTNLNIQETTGDINIRTYADDQDVVISTDDGSGGITEYVVADGSTGAVKLKHYGTTVFETTSTGASITNTSTSDALNITTTEDSSTAGPVINLKRNSSSVANSDYLGQIKFQGENDADQEVLYAKISGKILDRTDGSEDGILEFAFKKNGSNNISGRFRSDSLQLLNDTSLRVTGHIELKSLSGDPSGGTDLAQIYAKDDTSSAEVFVQDEAGNVTKISPHNEKGEWEYFSRNTKTGKTVRVNMEEMIKDIEKLTGKKYIKEE